MATFLFTSRGSFSTTENDAWYVQGSVMVRNRVKGKGRWTCIYEDVVLVLAGNFDRKSIKV